jgi:hypothetical protein
MAVAKPTPPKGSFCDGHRKTYPSDATSATHAEKTHLHRFSPNIRLVCGFPPNHGYYPQGELACYKPTLSIAVVNLTTPTKLESVCQSARTVYRRANLPSFVTVL